LLINMLKLVYNADPKPYNTIIISNMYEPFGYKTPVLVAPLPLNLNVTQDTSNPSFVIFTIDLSNNSTEVSFQVLIYYSPFNATISDLGNGFISVGVKPLTTDHMINITFNGKVSSPFLPGSYDHLDEYTIITSTSTFQATFSRLNQVITNYN